MVFEASAELATGNRMGCQREAAGAQRINTAHQLKHGSHGQNRGKRTKIRTPIPYDAAGRENTGKMLVSNHQVGIRLIVLESDVVAWLIGFDEGIFQQKRIHFRFGQGEIDAGDAVDHHSESPLSVKIRTEIAGNTLAQVFGLPYIKQYLRSVVIAVNPRTLGQNDFKLTEFFGAHATKIRHNFILFFLFYP
ncbi:MAG: hypothetical protein EBS53_04645 [Bacteroidetes bacterium]|nr:hypothetical protein [Bacteroidota bacterium]